MVSGRGVKQADSQDILLAVCLKKGNAPTGYLHLPGGESYDFSYALGQYS